MIARTNQFLRRYKHMNWALSDQAMVSGVNFLTGILLARYLGLEEFGRFTLAWMVVLFVNSIQHAAINSPMMSLGPKQTEAETPAFYGAAIIQLVIFSCATFIVLYASVRASAMLFPSWAADDLALPLAVAALAFQFQDFLRRYFFTRRRVVAAFINDAIRYIGQFAILAGMFISLGDAMDTTRVLWVIAFMAALAAISGAFLVERIEVNMAALRTAILRNWGFSKWLTASAILQWASGNLFIVAAGAMLGATAVGALKAAQNIMAVTHILFQGLENIVPTRAALHFHEQGAAALIAYLKRVTVYGGLVVAAVAAVAMIAPEFLLSQIYGSAFAEYGYVLRWYAAFYLLAWVNLPLTAGARAVEATKSVFKARAVAVIWTVITVYPLISLLGLNGVMVGSVLAMTVNIVILRRELGQRLAGNSGKNQV